MVLANLGPNQRIMSLPLFRNSMPLDDRVVRVIPSPLPTLAAATGPKHGDSEWEEGGAAELNLSPNRSNTQPYKARWPLAQLWCQQCPAPCRQRCSLAGRKSRRRRLQDLGTRPPPALPM